MRIVLTGGTGLVGRNFREHPGAGALEILAPTHRELDLADFQATLAYLREARPDLVVHAAGKVGGIQANIREPVAFLLENLDMGRNLVGAARAAGVPRLLNMGSGCMYPRGHDEPMAEELLLTGELEPTNEGYALAKAVTMRLCDYITREDPRFQYKTLIPCNLYGRYDRFDPAGSHLIPAIIQKVHQAMAGGGAPVEIWGDGTARREFLYAGDLADAMVRAATHFDTLPGVMNLGSGIDHSINDYYRLVGEAMGFRGAFTHDLSKPSGMARKLIHVGRQRAWGWAPGHDLAAGLRLAVDYYLQDLRP